MHSTRNDRRAAHDLKRGGETAYGVNFTRPIHAAGRHLNSANDARPCTECVVSGGDTQPGSNGLCDACRSLAAVFAAAADRGALS